MKTSVINYVLCAVVGILLSCGCSKNSSSAPQPLPVEQIQPVLAQALEKADSETLEEKNRYVASMQNHDLPAAFNQIQALCARPDLTPDQRMQLGRARMTTTQQLMESAASGNDEAAKLLHAYMSTR